MIVVMSIKDDGREKGGGVISWNETGLSLRSNAGILLKNTTVLSAQITTILSQLWEDVNEM